LRSNELGYEIFVTQILQQLELLAKVAAAERFQLYLRERQTVIIPTLQKKASEKPKLVWTDGESHFVELVYGLLEIGAFNDGEITLKALIDGLASMWGITLTQDVSRTWISLKGRAKGVDLYFQALASAVRRRAKKQDAKK
jgi:hypothetical protein